MRNLKPKMMRIARKDYKAYLVIVGSLMYTARETSQDNSYAVSFLGRFNPAPRTRHLAAAKRVLRYPEKSKQQRLLYTAGGDLHGFFDADWANGKDSKSVGEYVFLFEGVPTS